MTSLAKMSCRTDVRNLVWWSSLLPYQMLRFSMTYIVDVILEGTKYPKNLAGGGHLFEVATLRS